MRVLALDTSSKAASCAFWDHDTLVGEFFVNTALTHSQTILPMVDSLLKNAKRELKEVDIFAVSCGPGSFTGLRIGISAIKGMALSLDKPCAPISTLWGLALNLVGIPGLIVPVMDARRDQVYTALFHSDGRTVRRITEDQALSIGQLRTLLRGQPDDRGILLVGDGAKLCFEHLGDDIPHLRTAPEVLLYQRAGSFCTAALEMAKNNRMVSAEELAPSYLRLPQAERERLEKEKGA